MVVLQIVRRHQAARRAYRSGNLFGDRAFVEGARSILGNGVKRVRQIGLHQQCAAFDQRAIGLQEQFAGRRPFRHARNRGLGGVLEFVADVIALAGEIDGGSDELRQLEFARTVFLKRRGQARNGAWSSNAETLIA